MARAGVLMRVVPVDQDHNLFVVTDLVSSALLGKILSTPWMKLKFQRQPGQENWLRRRIDDQELPWLDLWQQEISEQWPNLEEQIQIKLQPYFGTAFWIDEPGFTCGIHTDGEMPGSLHTSWIGDPKLGTTFYHSKHADHVRYRHDFLPNSGYAMINMPDSGGYRLLQWHGMLEPVPNDSFRLTSYTWLSPVK